MSLLGFPLEDWLREAFFLWDAVNETEISYIYCRSASTVQKQGSFDNGSLIFNNDPRLSNIANKQETGHRQDAKR
jgi:hypothetical protein